MNYLKLQSQTNDFTCYFYCSIYGIASSNYHCISANLGSFKFNFRKYIN